jgi:predicted DNA-binding transcriptional regulator YafY
MMQRRYWQLKRTLALIRALRLGQNTVDQLAVRFGVTTRTIRRDLDALTDVGVPVVREIERGDASRFSIGREWRL